MKNIPLADLTRRFCLIFIFLIVFFFTKPTTASLLCYFSRMYGSQKNTGKNVKWENNESEKKEKQISTLNEFHWPALLSVSYL